MSNYDLNQITTTLQAGVPAQIAVRNIRRVSLAIMNVGTGGASVVFIKERKIGDANPVLTFGQGWTLDPASIVGTQGGALTWNSGYAPMNEVWAVSDVGTTISVLEG